MKTKIGGQAVIEGVMMRGETSQALAVRDENGTIRVDTKRLGDKKPWYRKVPFLRGIVNLFISLVDGMAIIGRSAEVMAEDELDQDDGIGGIMFFASLFGIVFALALFVVLPTYATKLIMKLLSLEDVLWVKSLFEGVFKLIVLIVYMSAISAMKDIKRVFMYHGAEHKTIACFEAELPLTVENVKKCSRYHDRCGTSFIVFVVLISIILMLCLDVVCYSLGFTLFMEKTWLRALLKIACLPLIAGVSYEFLMLLAKSNFVLFRPFKWLGKQMQKLTTREPDDEMCEVAICAFNKVLEMDADKTVAEEHFPLPVEFDKFYNSCKALCNEQAFSSNGFDWLIEATLGVKKGEGAKIKVPFGWQIRMQKLIQRVNDGEPLDRVAGASNFYGRKFAVNQYVLIPRMETELVAEKAIKLAKDNAKVLDLCCGSGCIGITVALEKKIEVTCSDVSKNALAVAKQNAKSLKANCRFVESNMFNAINGKFDLIVCNPPYIPSDEIEKLDVSVKDYEPRLALDGLADGLYFYRVLAEKAKEHLTDDGILVLEIGFDQGEKVKELFAEKFDVEVFKDYSQNDRIVVCKVK